MKRKLYIKIQSPIVITREKPWKREVKDALRSGQTILALKLYKEATGKSLRDSKDYIYDVLKPKYYRDPTVIL